MQTILSLVKSLITEQGRRGEKYLPPATTHLSERSTSLRPFTSTPSIIQSHHFHLFLNQGSICQVTGGSLTHCIWMRVKTAHTLIHTDRVTLPWLKYASTKFTSLTGQHDELRAAVKRKSVNPPHTHTHTHHRTYKLGCKIPSCSSAPAHGNLTLVVISLDTGPSAPCGVI